MGDIVNRPQYCPLPPDVLTATATTVTTSSSAALVFDQLDRHGSRIAAPASGTARAA